MERKTFQSDVSTFAKDVNTLLSASCTSSSTISSSGIGTQDADSRVFTSFAKVLTSDWNVFLSTPDIILDSMDLMGMGKRDKGAISNVQKYKSLNGRWFGAKKQNEEKEAQTFESGSIVSLEENGEKWFVVRAVFRESGNKWYMSTVVDNPSWPIDPVKGKKY